jgi:THAP4-like, heme-binding beta-barrel domain
MADSGDTMTTAADGKQAAAVTVTASNARLDAFKGVWKGKGHGEYPTMDGFEYSEQLTFSQAGKVMMMEMRTWLEPLHKPMHCEAGIWRLLPNGNTELVLSHATGMQEISTGQYDENKRTLTTETLNISRTKSAKQPAVTAVKREYSFESDHVLKYKIYMSTTTTPEMTLHLTASLQRQIDM